MNPLSTKSSIRAVITDWAGTIVDFGSLAPTTVVMEVFKRKGVPVTAAEARAPMGRAKRNHLAAVARMTRVMLAWQSAHGAAPSESDIDALYADFLPLQKQVLWGLSHVIPGVAETLSLLRQRGLKIGSTTGYTRELMSVVTAVAEADGIVVDALATPDDVPEGRPAPWLIFRAAEQLGVYPMSAVVVVDDTPVGIQAARNAGAWAVAVARTGNALGLSVDEAATLSAPDWAFRRRQIETDFLASGAHFVVDSFTELPEVISRIERGVSV